MAPRSRRRSARGSRRRCAAFTARAGPAARRSGSCWSGRSRVGDLRPQQGPRGRASRACGSICSGCRPTATLDDLLALVARPERQREHDGILVQSPLPAAMGRDAAQRVFDAIDPAKDVDGFTPVNVGRLAQGRAHLAPCTPSGRDRDAGSLRHRDRRRAARSSSAAARSSASRWPMLLLQRDATVTICHSKTANLAAVTARSRHRRRGDRPGGLRHPRVRQARRHRDRRRHEPRRRPRRRGGALRRDVAAGRRFRAARIGGRR